MYWFLLSVVTVWVVASPVQSFQYHYIVPDNTSACKAEPHSSVPSSFFMSSIRSEACTTLQQLVTRILNNSNEYFIENITLIFAPGSHQFVGGIQLNNTKNIIIKGQLDDGKRPEITCIHNKSCFQFRNSSNILIENLVFKECFSEDSNGGVMYISVAEALNLIQCSFVNNFGRKQGGALRLELINNLNILQNEFINNSVVCHPSTTDISTLCLLTQCVALGGAISATNITFFFIKDTLVDSNVASCFGGAISISSSYIIVRNCEFRKNKIVTFPGNGGGLSIFSSTAFVENSQFNQNHVEYSGGSFSAYSSIVLLRNCSLSFSKASWSGGGASFSLTQLLIIDTFFSNNVGGAGGAIAIESTYQNASFVNCIFENNTATSIGVGGALYLQNILSLTKFSGIWRTREVFSFLGCIFKSNSGGSVGGGAIYIFLAVLYITNCEFRENTGAFGGAIVANNNVAYIQNCSFIGSTQINAPSISIGGALYMGNGTLYSSNNRFLNNKVSVIGGAFHAVLSEVICTNDSYISNEAIPGVAGAISAYVSDISIKSCVFYKNIANTSGGALQVMESNFTSVQNVYTENSVNKMGSPSALNLIGSRVSCSGDFFHNQVAHSQNETAANYSAQMGNTTIVERDKSYQPYTILLRNVYGFCSNLTFTNNYGSMYVFASTLNFSGLVLFTENTGVAGGALTVVQSTLTFEELSQVLIIGNNATYGGGILLSQSELRVNSPSLTLSKNIATFFGGGLFGYQSRIIINVVKSSNTVLFTSNSAARDGGAMFAIATNLLLFRGVVFFVSNKALKGGAALLTEGSKLYLQKSLEEDLKSQLSINLTFFGNSAEYGGALYVDDVTNNGILCQRSAIQYAQVISNEECFIQTLQLYYPRNISKNKIELHNYINIFFHSNVATKFGNDIFGGLLDRCQINAFAEIQNFEIAKTFSGFNYLKTIANFQLDIDYYNLTHPFNVSLIVSAVTRKHVKQLISSDPVQLCFCINDTYDCSYQWPIVNIKRGGSFLVLVVTVDQVENAVSGTVLASTRTQGTNLRVDQSRQPTNGVCTALYYNVFSTEESATVELYPDGPCQSSGISSKTLKIAFLPCDCPKGLQKARIDNECVCECDDSVQSYVSMCQLSNDSVNVVRVTNSYWIQYHMVNEKIMTGFLHQTCPYDYCMDNPVNLSMSLPLNVNKQCSYNRSGIMCGECEEDLSLVFGSSRCVQCNNNYLALMIAFAFAGIALVAFILILNMTVAVGTIHGLILYANIVGANSAVFLPPGTASSYFVSWVNLDLGFESCFYDSMDSSTKVWLQLVFPAYIISLSAMIIIVSNYWGWFAGLIGRKNPVGTLCTLFLLSYSKLLRTTIGLLQFTYLSYPDGSSKLLWLYNPNIPYFTPSRIPCFIVAAIIIALGTVYTLMLFFGQWLRKIKRRRIARLFQNGKYNAFMDAYQAPFTFKHRYWVGILLFVRILHHFLSATLNQTSHLLIVCCLITSLVIPKMLATNIYKNWLIGFLETTHFINLLLFSVSTNYITVSSSTGAQTALANVSVIITFITFLGVALYHIHTHFLRDLRVYPKLSSAFKNCLHCLVPKFNILRGHAGENFDGELGNEMRPWPPSLFREPLLREPVLEDTALLPAQQVLIESSDAVSTPRNPQPVTRTIVCITNTDTGNSENDES